jgi:hypothetical protein
LASSGRKPIEVLKSQVIVAKLVHIIKDCINDEMKSECFLLLDILLLNRTEEDFDRQFLELQLLPLVVDGHTIESVNRAKILYDLLYQLEYKTDLGQNT